MHKIFLGIGTFAFSIGVAMLFGKAVPLIANWAPWPIVGAVTACLGAGCLVIGAVMWLGGFSTSWSRHVGYLTNPNTGDRVFGNRMKTPITITGIEKSDPNVDHWGIGLPLTLAPGKEVVVNPKRNPPGRSTLRFRWDDARGRTHSHRVVVTESGPLFPGVPIS